MGTASYSERENIFPNRPHWDENGVFISARNDPPICWCPKDTIQDDRICDFCKGIGLRHLIFCGEPKMIDLGNLSAIIERTDCDLCSLFSLGCRQILGEKDQYGRPFGTQSPCYINALDLHKQQIRGYPLQLSIAWQWVEFEIVLKKDGPSPRLVEKSFEVHPKVGIAFLKAALHNCDINHPDCKAEATSTPKEMRVIDLQNMSIGPAPVDCRYIALSYVWGRIIEKWLTLTRENMLSMREKNSLVEARLPQTIRDTIQLCNDLGERYLWVDSLCIVQDDPVFQKQQIDIMDEIYASAAFTIVAAAGDHADAGLPGVSTWVRDVKRQTLTIQDIEISNVLPKLRDTAERSIWNTRGWTYQERMFSKRCICLTEAQAFYTCSTGVEYELKDRLLPNGYGVERFRDPAKNADFKAVYAKNVADYSHRSLTNQADILRAFQGVVNEMSRQYGQSFYYGLPGLDFQTALLWQPAAQAVPRQVPGVVLPSWSWASLNGAIKYSFMEKIVTSESTTPLPAFWQEGKAPKFFQLDPMLSVDGFKLIRLKDNSSSIDSLEGLSISTAPEDISNLLPNTIISLALQKPGRLLFSTQSTSLPLLNSVPFKTADSWWTDYTTSVNLSHISIISILNPASPDLDDPIGFIELDKIWASQHLPTTPSNDTRRWEFIALSLATTKANDYMHRHFTQRRNINYPLVYSRNVRRLVVNVMLIGRKEDVPEVSLRLGIGKIYLDHWEQAGPKEGWVILE